MSERVELKLLILLFVTFSTHAQASLFSQLRQDLASPFTTEAKYYLLSGTALTLILTFDGVEDNLGHNIQNEAIDDKPLGRFSVWGDLAGQMLPNALYLSTLYGLYLFTDNLEHRKKSILMLKATAYTGLMTTIIKAIVREPRPNSNNRDSFPSGHTASAFAFASVIGTQHEWYWGVAAYSMAGFVAMSRINDNAHRLHDVVGGATLGLAYGLGLSYLNVKKSSALQKVYLSPSEDGVFIGYRTAL